ncbi:MAG: TAXI family TRAP transporter solute-binding subunit [Candidatus Vecturithrix sp.]|jgi:TRAP transporter TAXI family solute receptor|nr:TAXI family TRAP transporter solute-binding subunit [Candidatus Vecturithrix sp.]
MKKFLGMSSVVLLLVMVLCIPHVVEAKTVLLSFTTGSIGGTFYPIGGGIANLLVDEFPKQFDQKIRIASESSAGSLENVRRVHLGESEMGIVHASDMAQGYYGRGEFEGDPQTNLRVVAFLYGTVCHLVTLADSEIEKVEDLAGKKVAIGSVGSGSAVTAERFFTMLGMWEKIKSEYLPSMDASTKLKDGHIDAYNWCAGMPAAAVTDTASTHQIRILDYFTPAEQCGYLKEYPFYSKRMVPPGTYKGVDESVATIQSATMWVVNKDFDEDLLYKMLSIVYAEAGLKYLATVHQAATEMSMENAVIGAIIPMHKGAYKFWQEKGREIPETAQPIE